MCEFDIAQILEAKHNNSVVEFYKSHIPLLPNSNHVCPSNTRFNRYSYLACIYLALVLVSLIIRPIKISIML